VEKSKNHICIVGAAIMDLMGFTEHDIKISDSVPGSWKEAPGGVGRNIAENLSRLGFETRLITAFGSDPLSQILIDNAIKTGIDISGSLRVPGEKAATFIAILDKDNDLYTGIAALQIIQKIDIPLLQSRQSILQNAAIVVADTNIPQESLRWLAQHENIDQVYLDLVSMKLAEKVKSFYGKFHTLKTNKLEAELLCGVTLKSKEDFKLAAEEMIKAGVRRIFITAGKEGVFYSDGKEGGWLNPILVEVQNTTGAGDAFMSGITYGSMNSFSIRECAKMGLGAAAIALESTSAVNAEISPELILKYVDQHFNQ
jgi:pseudouridine kinase